MLESLRNRTKEEVTSYIEGLSNQDKAALFAEIDNNTKAAQEEFIRLEATNKKLEEDEAAQMEKLKSMGINSYEELDREINRLETQINSEIVNYVEALKGE